MKNQVVCRIAFAAIIPLLIGCASSSTIKVTQPVSVDLQSLDRMSVFVKSEIQGAETEVESIRNRILASLRSWDRFSEATGVTGGVKFDFALHVELVTLSRVSTGARIMVGAFAGRATVGLVVELLNTRTGATVGACSIEGKSSGGSVFAGTTEQAIERAVERVMEFIGVTEVESS